MQSYERYPWDEVWAEIYAAAVAGEKGARVACVTCGAHYISIKDAHNHNAAILAPGQHIFTVLR